jgi:hypothetical protein
MAEGRATMFGTPKQVFARAEELKHLGLDAPLASEVAWRLRQKGLLLPDITTDEELAEVLCL